MNLHDLPGYPPDFSEFFSGMTVSGSGFRACRDAGKLLRQETEVGLSRQGRIRLSQLALLQAGRLGIPEPRKEILQKLERAETAILAVYLPESHWGGSFAQVLKVLTGLKLAGSLERNGAAAIPVCCFYPRMRPVSQQFRFLDADAKVQLVNVADGFDSNPDDFKAALTKIAEAWGQGCSSENLNWLGECLTTAKDSATSIDRVFAGIFRDWPLVFLDAGSADFWSLAGEDCQNSLLPFPDFEKKTVPETETAHTATGAEQFYPRAAVILEAAVSVSAVVVDESDLWGRVHSTWTIAGSGGRSPELWPRVSATLVDSRSRRTLDRYSLSVASLFGGVESVLKRLSKHDEAGSVMATLAGLSERVGGEMAGLRNTLPEQDELALALDDARSRIHYQMKKLVERFSAAHKVKNEAMVRHLERTCAHLVPGGKPQELGLSAAYFLLRYSPALLDQILEKIDETSDQHQLIPVE